MKLWFVMYAFKITHFTISLFSILNFPVHFREKNKKNLTHNTKAINAFHFYKNHL